MVRISAKAAVVALLLIVLPSCGGALNLERVNAAIHPTGRVDLLVSASSSEGPVSDLESRNFAIFEDGRPLTSPREAVVSRPTVALHTLLLLDLSGSPGTDELGQMAEATQLFLAGLPAGSTVAVFGFDGSEQLHPLVPQTTAPQASASVERIVGFTSPDPSRDLYLAYKLAVGQLDEHLATSPEAVGALVLVSRGPDLAARLEKRDLQQVVEMGERDFTRIAIGVGEEGSKAPLGMVSSWDPIHIGDLGALGAALEDAAKSIDALGRSYYFVSMCSAARGGRHTLEIKAERTTSTREGKQRTQRGRLRYQYDATGFGPGCVPSGADEADEPDNADANADADNADATAPSP